MSPEAKGQTNGKDAKDMQEFKLTVASSPHVRCNETIPKIMWNVVAALVPAAAFGVYYFGVNALVNIIVANCLGQIVFEFLWEKLNAQTRHHHKMVLPSSRAFSWLCAARRAFPGG